MQGGGGVMATLKELLGEAKDFSLVGRWDMRKPELESRMRELRTILHKWDNAKTDAERRRWADKYISRAGGS